MTTLHQKKSYRQWSFFIFIFFRGVQKQRQKEPGGQLIPENFRNILWGIHLGKEGILSNNGHLGKGWVFWGNFLGWAFDNGISSNYRIGCAATGFCGTHKFQTGPFFGEGKEYDVYSLVDSTVDRKNPLLFGGCCEKPGKSWRKNKQILYPLRFVGSEVLSTSLLDFVPCYQWC